MRRFYLSIFLLCSTVFAEKAEYTDLEPESVKKLDLSQFETGIVKQVQQIQIKDFPEAFNPSICRFKDHYLLTFRVLPNPRRLYHSEIGLLLLDEKFQPLSGPLLLNTRENNHRVISQSEDARIISHKGRVFLVYNDNDEKIAISMQQRRDIYIAELVYEEGQFRLLPPLRVQHNEYVNSRMWEKNWSPFFWNDILLMIYNIHPHEILYPRLKTGVAQTVYLSNNINDWPWGGLRGGSQAELVDGEYLTFFHSSANLASNVTGKKGKWHYFMGAYTFSPEPPFQILRQSPFPISHEEFYTDSDAPKRVVYPSGFVVNGAEIVVAYGKDDREVWLAFLDKEALLSSLKPVEQQSP